MFYLGHAVRSLWQRHICQAHHPLGLISLSLVVGCVSATAAILFRYLLELPKHWLEIPAEHLLPFQLVSLAIGGSILILLFSRVNPKYRSVGVPHVLHRLHHRRGHLPLPNFAMQWLGALIALLSGHSLGREGPAIHLGAACASQIGQASAIPNHRLRILVGCGVAGAVAAFFNTPLAAMFLTMEVILVGYSIRRLLPIGLSAICGALISQAVFGDTQIFIAPVNAGESLANVTQIILLGLVGGIVAASFLVLVRYLQQLNQYPLWLRWGGLTLLTMLAVSMMPDLFGMGYDTINDSLTNRLALITVVMLLVAKLLLTAWAAAVRFPAGIIGPTLFMGAMFGSVMGLVYQALDISSNLSPGFCALLGMGIMMGGILRAPLAALIALLELSSDPNIILPGVLAIISATLLVSEILRLPSVFTIQLDTEKDPLRASPITELLRSRWIKPLMRGSVIRVQQPQQEETSKQLPAQFVLAEPPTSNDTGDNNEPWYWLVDHHSLVPATAISVQPDLSAVLDPTTAKEPTATIKITCNLQDALDLMDSRHLNYLVVVDHLTSEQPLGVLWRNDIEASFHYHSDALSH